MEPVIIPNVAAFVELVEQGKMGIAWTVYSEVGPNWIGSRRVLHFYSNGTPLEENELIVHLANKLTTGLAIPDKSQDHVITGEGDLRRNGNALKVIYD